MNATCPKCGSYVPIGTEEVKQLLGSLAWEILEIYHQSRDPKLSLSPEVLKFLHAAERLRRKSNAQESKA